MKNTKTMTFMMGLPASGKSTLAKKMFADTKILDSDKYKEMHVNYDPKKPETLHKWSSEMERAGFELALKGDEDIVIDGTGTNAEKMAYRIEKAMLEGFETKLIFVVCNLKTSLERNSKRERVVPEFVVKEKYETIQKSFEIVAPLVNKVEVIKND